MSVNNSYAFSSLAGMTVNPTILTTKRAAWKCEKRLATCGTTCLVTTPSSEYYIDEVVLRDSGPGLYK